MPKIAKTKKVKTKKSFKTSKKITKKEKKIEEPVQPEINIGLVGHVDHGKTTLVKALSGKWTDTHSEEIKRGITIRLGYADTVFRKCPKCKEPECFCVNDKCPRCKTATKSLRKVSFVDAPGHESLMATMLSGATIIDYALLLIAANEECPQPQTREHLMALEILGIKKMIIVQNKIDVISDEQAMKNYNQIKEFIKGTTYEDSPIIPISAQHSTNIDALIQTIEEYFPTPKKDASKEPIMFVARSFDINPPGSDPIKINGGVLGGALKQGKLMVNDEIEIKPGRDVEKSGKKLWEPITTKIVGLKTGGSSVKEIFPGGSVAIMTLLDPAIVKSDSLTGSVVGKKGMLPKVWYNFILEIHLLERVVGLKDDIAVEQIKLNEVLMLNVNSAATIGFVTELKKDAVSCSLKIPVCAEQGSRISISRRIGTRWRLIGYGIIKE
ncbi:translation initiation factor IF-2 subunit gamma [Candidatus Woesearchaeota archaeon CG_4_10_14_0_2_um_filter_33_10]|nr:MAG: translation initiation factor IF-2 subunit gamma [Candidatus Woesearchaeota archaeon CG10_big_fil_rev_8_21_14_0_10_33_12]PIU72213.1 MAG: translation initiation factor IF-2 subunit gamma [Candidatus Woesearchaeota archaeon CG06_land_8_20_14_3_00_33_13]PIZ53165.1 MAG: translation initiation factor IF-2 subunit gamma [Candidatus Woesearchaeota archaeon CG_4_10_14_0_2_um_filter_33_10]